MKQLAIILGGSGAMGLACAEVLSALNYNLIIIHRDSRSRMPEIEADFSKIREKGIDLISFNLDVNDEQTINKVIEKLSSEKLKVKVLIHAVANGNIGEIFSKENPLTKESFIHTFNSMSLSWILWSQALVENNLFDENARIIGLTSEGSSRTLPFYSAVGMAKASMEVACKYMAIELATKNIRVNVINAGITDTKALQAFPNYNELIEKAKKRNPFKKLTTPENIAKVVGFLVSDNADWITGEIIRVDGGEQLMSF